MNHNDNYSFGIGFIMSNNMPLVSIIVPIYNCAQYIQACLNSLVYQTYQKLEIIIIDDGSTDSSCELIKANYSSDSRVRYIYKQNEGVSKARNVGIQAACGEYITFVDGDDVVSHDFIKEALEIITVNSLDFVQGYTKHFRSDSDLAFGSHSTHDIEIFDGDLTLLEKKVLSNGIVGNRLLDSCLTSAVWCKVFKANIVKQASFQENLTIGEDTVFDLDIINASHRVGATNHIWYFYRYNPSSATKACNHGIRSETEKTIRVLAEKYRQKETFAPYFKVRAVQQFSRMLLIYPFHSDAGISLAQKKAYLKACMLSEPWSGIFLPCNAFALPSRLYDKLLYLFCSWRNEYLAFVLLETKRLLKKS